MPSTQVGPETSLQYRRLGPVPPSALPHRAVALRQQRLRQHPEAGADPAAGRRRHEPRRHADHRAERQRRRVRGRDDRAGAGARELRQRAHLGHRAQRRGARRGHRHARAPPSRICARRTRGPGCPPTSKGARRRPTPGSPCAGCGRTDACGSSPTLHVGWEQTHLSSLDLGDRRTGAGRTRDEHPGVLPERRARQRLGRPRRRQRLRHRRRSC